MGDLLFLLLAIGIPALSQFVSTQMRRHFVTFSRDPMPLSGREAAERMLASYSIQDVQVISTEGQLTDHYDPANGPFRFVLPESLLAASNRSSVLPPPNEWAQHLVAS